MLVAVTLVLSFVPQAAPAQAQSGAYDLVNAVNQLRAANGLPPYQVNNALMAAAQAHSEFMASNNVISHTGAGGSRPIDRAMGSGFGGGAQAFVSENIASGVDWGAADAVSIWQGDQLHLNTMLSGDYTDIGAGVAVGGHLTYFTIDVGYISGSPGSGSAGGSAALPTIAILGEAPVATATPQPDGSIIHTIQTGQALWNVAAIYGIELAELLEMNNLTDSAMVFVGDKLIVKTADPPPTATLTPTEPYVRPSETPTLLDTPTPQYSPTPEETVTPTPAPSMLEGILPAGVNSILLLVGFLVGGGLVLLVTGTVIDRFE